MAFPISIQRLGIIAFRHCNDLFDSHGCQEELSWAERETPKWERVTRNNKLKPKIGDGVSQRNEDKSQQRERETQRLMLIHPVSQTTELQAEEGDGEEEEDVRQSEEDRVRQRDHSNTDLFTD